jgi:HD domain
VPGAAGVASHRRHFLAYIPWHDQYAHHFPREYHDFFRHVQPYLSVRTSDVHTAVSASLLPELMAALGRPDDLRVLYLALILHDCGWHLVSDSRLADSLDYPGVIYTRSAAQAKVMHTILGAAFALRLLDSFKFQQKLSIGQQQFISDIILYHERPQHYRPGMPPPLELTLVCEADRLWPFTRENFWLDTVRKGVEPHVYVENVAADIPRLLLTPAGRSIARRLATERRREVEA